MKEVRTLHNSRPILKDAATRRYASHPVFSFMLLSTYIITSGTAYLVTARGWQLRLLLATLCNGTSQ
jgi:hypothetical protein